MTVAEMIDLLSTQDPHARVFLYVGKAIARTTPTEARPTGVFVRGTNDADVRGGADASPDDVFIG